MVIASTTNKEHQIYPSTTLPISLTSFCTSDVSVVLLLLPNIFIWNERNKRNKLGKEHVIAYFSPFCYAH